MLLSYCVVNTNGRELPRALPRRDRAHAPGRLEPRCSCSTTPRDDGSRRLRARPQRPATSALIALDRRTGKAENDSTLLQEARGRYALLLNEDAELQAGAPSALVAALDDDPQAAVAAAQLLDPDGSRSRAPGACPGVGTALAQARLPAQALRQSQHGDARGRLGPVERDARAPRGGRGGRLPRPRLLRLLRRDRLPEAPARRGLARSCSCPRRRRSTTSSCPPTSPPRAAGSSSSTATATSTCASTTAAPPALAVRVLTAWAYALQGARGAGSARPRPRRYRLHAVQALLPEPGRGNPRSRRRNTTGGSTP